MRRLLLASAVVAASAGAASASITTFFGFDAGQGENVRLASHANSDAARANFFSNLINVGTEDMEGFANGAGAGIVANFNGGRTATFNGTGNVANVPTGTNGVGRYPISGNQYWESGDNFSLTFNQPIAAFGFYGIDIGDFNGQVTLTLANTPGPVVVNIGNPTGGLGGSVLYFGLIRTEADILGIQFGNTQAGVDFFGFDDFSIGGLENVVIPLPSVAGMSLAGLAVIGIRRRRNA